MSGYFFSALFSRFLMASEFSLYFLNRYFCLNWSSLTQNHLCSNFCYQLILILYSFRLYHHLLSPQSNYLLWVSPSTLPLQLDLWIILYLCHLKSLALVHAPSKPSASSTLPSRLCISSWLSFLVFSVHFIFNRLVSWYIPFSPSCVSCSQCCFHFTCIQFLSSLIQNHLYFLLLVSFYLPFF